MSVARVLEAITADEAVAHIESRVAFLERQIQTLGERRDQLDQGLQAALEVMRARIEDALVAVEGSEQQYRTSAAELESRLLEELKAAERRTRRDSRKPSVRGTGVESVGLEAFENRIEDQLHSQRLSQTNTMSALAGSIETRLVRQSEVLREFMATFRTQIEGLLGGELRELQGGMQSVSQLQIKLDELANRISSADARWASERASLAARLEALESLK